MTDIHAAPAPIPLIRIEDPDAPIYRIFPLWFFEDALRRQELVLAAPRVWEDPYEVLPESVVMTDLRQTPPRPEELQPYLLPAFAQSWSGTGESDTLLRAYSRVQKDRVLSRNIAPRSEGVRVRSTARKLITAALGWADAIPNVACYLGSVRYGSAQQITEHFCDLIAQHGPHAVGQGRLRAESLLLKRIAFAHENEVRLICVDGRGVANDDVLRLRISPNEVFEEVTYDPRLVAFERNERETVARSLGYANAFGESDRYVGVLVDARFPNGWPGAGPASPSA